MIRCIFVWNKLSRYLRSLSHLKWIKFISIYGYCVNERISVWVAEMTYISWYHPFIVSFISLWIQHYFFFFHFHFFGSIQSCWSGYWTFSEPVFFPFFEGCQKCKCIRARVDLSLVRKQTFNGSNISGLCNIGLSNLGN